MTDAATVTAATPNPERMKKIGGEMQSRFEEYARDRRIAETRWAQNLRQFLGQYDAHIEAVIPKDRSRAYPKLTRIKCVSMVARLMNMLFPASERNWTVEASPVPNLTVDDLNSILAELQKNPQVVLNDDIINNAVLEFARKRARYLEAEIADQLTELGGGKMVSYVALCKKVVVSGVLFGVGVLKGPMSRTRNQTRWGLSEDQTSVVAHNESIVIPQFEFVPIWDYYPDMSAKYWHQMDGQFQRIVMSRWQVRKLADDPQFFGGVIKDYLRDHREGNYKQRPFESDLKSMGVAINTPLTDRRKYEVLVWDGGLSGHDLKACGVEVPDAKLSDMVKATLWLLEDRVIRANLDPWGMLGEDEPIAAYHQFVFEEDDTSLLGNGLPYIMRDSQLGVAATTRMALDNAGVVCGPNVEVATELLATGQDTTGISAYKVWERDDDSPATLQYPAVRSIAFDSHLDELLKVCDLFRKFADEETFVNPATGGDMQRGPSEPFRTAAGASMLRGEAALPFKDVVRNYDVFTESVIGSIIVFNKHFNGKQSIKGDFQPVARGSTSLIAKEVRGVGLDQLVQTLTPAEQLYIDSKKLLRERLAARDIPQDIMVDDAEAARREEAQAQQQQLQQSMMQQLMGAQLREVLSNVVKNMAQADKNAAGADATTYNAVLDGLERGATPHDVAAARVGTGSIPDGMLTRLEVENQPAIPGSTGGGKKK